MAPSAVNAANAREWPTDPIRRGDHQHPIKKPMKWDDPKSPIWDVVNPTLNPDNASSGPTPPELSCNKLTDKNRAAKDMMRRMEAASFIWVLSDRN
jgi:hypothetical protein